MSLKNFEIMVSRFPILFNFSTQFHVWFFPECEFYINFIEKLYKKEFRKNSIMHLPLPIVQEKIFFSSFDSKKGNDNFKLFLSNPVLVQIQAQYIYNMKQDMN